MEAVKSLLTEKPAVKGLLQRMNETQIRWAIFAGSEVAFLTANRTPTDLDIIVHNDDFEKLAVLLPEAKRGSNKAFLVVASDGERLEDIASTLTLTLDSVDIDIMSHSRFKTSEGIFPTYLTDVACQRRLIFEIAATTVYLAHPFDTILIKAFMRRGQEQGKFDAADAQALTAAVKIEPAYVRARIAETGLNSGARAFLQKLALITK
ncbi:MAG TPA: hypothetical protein VFZ58_02750 [Candidatus Saccharimonadales bacterium]